MPSKPETGVTSVGSQRDNRYPDTFFDQHRSEKLPDGRPWNGVRELSANKGERDGFCSGMTPGDHNDKTGVPQWVAPWYPEHRFFKFNYLRSKISIDYVAMMAHDQLYSDAYYEAAAIISMEKGLPPIAEGALPPYMIRTILKSPPRSPKIAAACIAGDPWILGFTTEPNMALQSLINNLTLNHREAAAATIAPQDVMSVTANELKDMIAAAVDIAVRASAKPAPKLASARPLAASVG